MTYGHYFQTHIITNLSRAMITFTMTLCRKSRYLKSSWPLLFVLVGMEFYIHSSLWTWQIRKKTELSTSSVHKFWCNNQRSTQTQHWKYFWVHCHSYLIHPKIKRCI